MTTAVRIPAYYEDRELVAGEDLARQPAFWLAHLRLTIGDPCEDAARYGVDESAYEQIVERLSDHEQPWPVLRMPFAGGHTAYVVYANFEDEGNVEFFVGHPGWGRLGFLGQYGVDQAGPGLSWAELTALAAAAPEGGEGLSDPAQRLLLLLPMLGDADVPADAVDIVERALTRCGFSADVAGALAAALDEPRVSEEKWLVGEDSPVPVCSSPHSPRRIPLALGITPDQARALADALRGAHSALT
ncbi:hypothetical protein ACFYXS_26265 [Streptomyces sp. NPDC002574]|uniref:hypothetical protein n=1 Tax=Streptomyces sp. NPDC002574 TaxID=3364652 RepID=UPI0036AA5714